MVDSKNKTQKKDLVKLMTSRAGLSPEIANEIAEKSFSVSKDKKNID